MTYIKLLTVLAGLALLTACGGGTPADKAGGDNNTGGGGGGGGGGGENATNCTTTPFHADCSADAPALILRRTMCLANTAIDPSCTGATGIATLFCTNDPFHNSPACMADTYDPTRATKITECSARAMADDPTCATALTRPNVATWLQSFTTELRTEPFNTAEQNAENDFRGHFLQGTANGLNLGDNTATVNTLNFNDAFNNGNMTDGVAYLSGIGNRLYAGIFSGTDLGTPVTGTNGTTAEWRGFIHGGNFFTNLTAFPLTVGFTGTGGTLDAFISHPDGRTTQAFTIDGDFDVNGVITGTVERGNYEDTSIDSPVRTGGSAGKITGLIGQEGAVAAFVSDFNVASPFSGGFVALPPALDGQVDYRDWLAIGETVAMPSTPVKNEFISGILAAGVPDEDGSVANHRSYGANTLNNAIHKDGTFGGDGNDGVVPVNATNGSYVGILPTTNLGAPLTEPTASAEWQGVLWGAHTRTSERGSFTPTINFTAKTITGTVADRAVDDTDFAVISGNNFPTGVNYSFTASFDNPRGQLTGTITRTVDSVASAGTIRGIIGEEGAVAGFISDAGADLSYAGGFVARPTPSE